MKTPFVVIARIVPIVSLIMLLILLPAGQVLGQVPTGTLWVTYVNATPTTVGLSDNLEIIFRAVYFCCDPYLGTVGNPADGIETASFLVVSILTQQSKEYKDIPVFEIGKGEYRAEIQIAQDGPTGRVWVYVEGNSLRSLSCFCGDNPVGETVGPPGNTSSEQTYDTADLSLIEIGVAQPSSPSPWDQLMQGSGLWLLLLAALIILLLAVSLLARRRGKPAS